MRPRIQIKYEMPQNAYTMTDVTDTYTQLTTSQMLRKLKHYPSDMLVDFVNTPKSVQNQVLRSIRH